MVARALPKVIASAPVVRPLRLAAQTVEMAKSWARLTPTQSLELLHFRYTDSSLCIVKMLSIPMIEFFIDIRALAVDWISEISDDELVDYLFVLVEALKYEHYHDSALARFLFRRALGNPR